MSINDLEKAIALIDKEFLPSEYLFNGPCSLEAVENAEKVLAIQFPKTYKIFLLQKGSGGVVGQYFYGLGKNDTSFSDSLPEVTAYHVVWSNLYERKYFKHPNHLLSIYNVGEGSTYCLDTSQMNSEGECPVVVWTIEGYDATPKLEVVAEDFGKLFLDMVQQQLEEKKKA